MSIIAAMIAAGVRQSAPAASPEGAKLVDVRQPPVAAALLVEAGMRAGIDSEGDLVIHLDIAAEGGMTRANFRDTLG